MTEFEQQVSEALRPLFSDGTRNYMDDCPLVAPRVAEALDTALYGSELEDIYRAKVLAILRGTPK